MDLHGGTVCRFKGHYNIYLIFCYNGIFCPNIKITNDRKIFNLKLVISILFWIQSDDYLVLDKSFYVDDTYNIICVMEISVIFTEIFWQIVYYIKYSIYFSHGVFLHSYNKHRHKL